VTKQAGRQARSHTGTVAGRQACRDVRAWEGREECRGYGKSNRKRCGKTDAPMHILTGRTTHAQSCKTNGHTGGQCEIVGTGRKIDNNNNNNNNLYFSFSNNSMFTINDGNSFMK
jgi:hypothetical protein